MPILFVFALIVLVLQYIFDRLLIAYYYSYHYEFDDQLNEIVRRIIVLQLA